MLLDIQNDPIAELREIITVCVEISYRCHAVGDDATISLGFSLLWQRRNAIGSRLSEITLAPMYFD